MNDMERFIRNQVAHYRATRSLNLIKAVVVVIVGLLLAYLSLTGEIFAKGRENEGLVGALGPEGAKVAALAISAVITLIGVIWAARLVRDLSSGVRAFENTLRRQAAENAMKQP